MNNTRISLGSLAVITAFSFSSIALAAPTDEAALMKEAKVSKADAEKTALANVPNGTIKSEEIEREHGKLIWSFDIAKPGTKDITEIQVDAISGKIIHTEIEKPKDQAKEAVGEKTEKKIGIALGGNGWRNVAPLQLGEKKLFRFTELSC